MNEYRDSTYIVKREERETPVGKYAYEFVLYVDGENVKTASELEHAGHDSPKDGGENWTMQLHRYAEAFIDGKNA